MTWATRNRTLQRPPAGNPATLGRNREDRVTDATEGESESTWTRLRRRKVVQWGIAYAAGAWGLLQGIGFVADAFDWPAQVQQLATLALADRPPHRPRPRLVPRRPRRADASAAPNSRSSRCCSCSAAVLFWRYGTRGAPSPDGRHAREAASCPTAEHRRRRRPSLDRRAAVREPQRRAQGRLLRRRHPRRHPDAALQDQRDEGHLAHLGRALPRHEAARRRRSASNSA